MQRKTKMKIDMILGLQWGDEGKGKIVDVLTKDYDIIARFQGGPNAGHTLIFDGIKHVLHTIPSGIFHENKVNVVGNGVVIDPVIFKNEIEKLKAVGIDLKNKLYISKKAHLILPTHRIIDQASELSKGTKKIGSTLKGIGPTYMDKTGRNGLRIGDLDEDNWIVKYENLKNKHLDLIKNFNVNIDFDIKELSNNFFDSINYIKKIKFIDSEHFFNESLKNGKKIIAEGAQGSLLDIDFGTYPFVTSSTTTAAGACTGLGVAPNKINDVIGIFKAYTTRVGSGPFPTELHNDVGKKIAQVGKEFGATTGRPRRCGWLDLVALKHSIIINGVTKLAIMKGDVLSGLKKIKICTKYKYRGELIDYLPFSLESKNVEPIYEEFDGWYDNITDLKNPENLPNTFKNYIKFIEKQVGVKIKIISVGPDRKQTIIV